MSTAKFINVHPGELLREEFLKRPRMSRIFWRGKYLDYPLKGTDVILVTTTGRHSGKERTVPLLYLEDGDDLIVVASQGGMPTNPAWYYNVTQHPDVTVNRRGQQAGMVAREVKGSERAELWPRLVEMYADYTDYAARTERTIPVIRLSPA